MLSLSMLICGMIMAGQHQKGGLQMTKILVAFFSRSGNTQVLATLIQQRLGGELCEIAPEERYPADYNAVVEQARKELAADARPPLAATVEDMASFEVIFLGYPNWCSTIPMPVFTFLEAYDFSGKTIVPFCTHGSGGLGRSVSDIRKLCPTAHVLDGLAIRGDSVKAAEDTVSAWQQKLPI